MAMTSKRTWCRTLSRRCALPRRPQAAFRSRSIPRDPPSNDLLHTWKSDHDSGRFALTTRVAQSAHRGDCSGRLLASLSVLFSMQAYGHGFGMRYDLPLPLGLWIIGAGGAIVLSFLIVAIAVRAHASVEAPAQPISFAGTLTTRLPARTSASLRSSLRSRRSS